MKSENEYQNLKSPSPLNGEGDPIPVSGRRIVSGLATILLTTVAIAGWSVWSPIGEPGALHAQTKKESAMAAVMRGRRIFEKRCVMCHGATGKGDGVRAMSLDVRPANLSVSTLTDAQQARIIEKGGAAVGRSPLMPVWGNEFSKKEIRDLVKYLQAINVVRK